MDDTVETTNEKGVIVSYIPTDEVDKIKGTCYTSGAVAGFIIGVILALGLSAVL